MSGCCQCQESRRCLIDGCIAPTADLHISSAYKRAFNRPFSPEGDAALV